MVLGNIVAVVLVLYVETLARREKMAAKDLEGTARHYALPDYIPHHTLQHRVSREVGHVCLPAVSA